MLTYLPSPDFKQCARLLHPAHLKRCIQEATWIGLRFSGRPNTSISKGTRWQPVFSLWTNEFGRPYLWALRQYQLQLNKRWMDFYGASHVSVYEGAFMDKEGPVKLTWPDSVHQSHRNRLVAHPRLGMWYSQIFEMNDLPFQEGTAVQYLNPTEQP